MEWFYVVVLVVIHISIHDMDGKCNENSKSTECEIGTFFFLLLFFCYALIWQIFCVIYMEKKYLIFTLYIEFARPYDKNIFDMNVYCHSSSYSYMF